jgi:hypothetical protein
MLHDGGFFEFFQVHFAVTETVDEPLGRRDDQLGWQH